MRGSIARTTSSRSAATQLRQAATPDESQPDTDRILDAAVEFNLKDFEIRTEHGRRVLSGIAEFALDRDRFFDTLKEIDGWERDFVLDIRVERSDPRGFHTVARGETLGSIAQRYLGRASREMDILEANRDRMNDPDQVFPGQQLLIPWR